MVPINPTAAGQQRLAAPRRRADGIFAIHGRFSHNGVAVLQFFRCDDR